MNYEEMSDSEINKLAERACGMYCEDCGGRYIPTMDYCNNPSDAWPVIKENKIGTVPVNEWWRASSVIAGYHEQHDDNPLRAAMIVFLMMKDTQNV